MKMERKKKNEKKIKGNSSLKVVYISSPMKVKTTVSRFRELVQQLTGRDSDITKSLDIVHNCNNFIDHPQQQKHESHYFSLHAVGDSPSSSESLIDQQDVSEPINYLDKSLSPNEEEEGHQYPEELQYFSLPVDGDRTRRDSDSPSSSESVIEQQQQDVFGNCEAFLSSQEADDQFLEDVFTSSLFFEQYSQSHLV